LTTLFGRVESAELPIVQAVATKKHGWLPLLVVLFLISYGLMTMLIVEQGRTIESQRSLIRDLFHDSTELSAVKMKAHSQQQAAPAQSVTKNSSTRNPSTQTPSTQAPAKQSPSTQAGSQQRIQNQVKKQKSFQMPSRPASDLMDSARSLITI
jgi:cytoskeletal protein RodZ